MMTLTDIQEKAEAYFRSCGYTYDAELLSVAYTARIALRRLKQFEQADYFGAIVRRRANIIMADDEILQLGPVRS